MDSRFIALAVPFFFLLIGVELWWNHRHGDSRYRLHDSLGSLSSGIGQQAIDVVFKVLTLAAYVYIFAHARIMTWSMKSVGAWILISVLIDFLYYAFHRASHRINFLWAMHGVHHQSEEYNLSTALRQSWLDPFCEWTFYIPLAVLGFPPAMYAGALSLNRIYQFWIHTRAIKRLNRPVEAILNTPSHHRVHHGIDPRYIDKNYAGIFIIWDRLLGTFESEGPEPTYGTVKPLQSFDGAWANFAEWARIWSLARGAQTWKERVWAWFAPPEWRPVALGGSVTVPEVDHATYRKFDHPVARGLSVYVLVQFVLMVLLQTALLWWASRVSTAVLVGGAATVVATIVAWGGLVQARRGAVEIEWLRLAGVGALGIAALHHWGRLGAVEVGALLLPLLACAVWVSRYRNRSAGVAQALDGRSRSAAA